MPYILVGCVILLIVVSIYAYKHRNEILREVFPDQFKNEKKVSKNAKIRPNAKGKSFRGRKPVAKEEVKQRTPKPNVESNRQRKKRREAETTEENEEDSRISDLTLDTKDNPLSAMTVNGKGTLLIASGKKHMSFLFAITGLDYQMIPFVQQFTLDEGDVTAVSALQANDTFQLVYSENKSKTISASTITFDDEAKVVVTKNDFNVQRYSKSVQKVTCETNGKYVMMLTDSQQLRIFDNHGDLLHELQRKDKKSSELCVTSDFKRLALATGSSVEIFNIVETPIINLSPHHTVKLNASVVSTTWAEKTGQLIAATTDGLITVFKKDVKDGVFLKFNSTGVRIVKACPSSQYLAIISGRAKLQIVRIDTGQMYSQLDTVHRGGVHFIEWSINGKWLFVASKAAPNIEVFHFVPNEEQ